MGRWHLFLTTPTVAALVVVLWAIGCGDEFALCELGTDCEDCGPR